MVQTKNLSIVCEYNETCVPCSVFELKVCLPDSLPLACPRKMPAVDARVV